MLPLILLLAAQQEPSRIDTAIRRLSAVYAMVERHAATPVSPHQALYEGAIPSMLRQLDPHSIFLPPEQFQQLREMEKSTHKGFGTVVTVLPGRVIVLQTLAGTPASRAGLEAGDEIVIINGIRLDMLDMEQLVGLLGETRQREAQLGVRRQGTGRLLPFTLKPEDLASETVDRAFAVRPGVGYVRVTSFESETTKQLRDAIESLGGASLKALVLDLRNNPGGLMPPALDAAAMLLPAGTKILTVRGRATEPQEIKVPEKATPYSFPVAVLVNGKSASGSEIVAGAVQDHKRGPVIGERTFGKGLVQSVYNLAGGSGLALTTAFYYTPSGRSIQKPLAGTQLAGATQSVRGGVTPDHVVAPPALTRLMMVLDATGAFPRFATEFLRRNPSVTESFEAAGEVMDRFRAWCSERSIQPAVSQWIADAVWIRARLKQEILNQALGVKKGDEVELGNDPVV
ncbi:MAG: S41 family peptidase, partial [Bryobacteraceae bacterium]